MNVRSCKMSESDNSRSESWVQHSETVWHPSREVTLMIASQVAKVVKNLPTNAGDTRNTGSIPGSGRSPGRRRWQPTLVFLAWRIPWTEEPGGLYSPRGHKESDMTEWLHFHFPGTELRPYHFCLSFCLLYFFLPPFKENGLLFWVPDVLCQYSEVVLWNLLSV